MHATTRTKAIKGRQIYHLHDITIEDKLYYLEVSDKDEGQFSQNFNGVPIYYILVSNVSLSKVQFRKKFMGPLKECGYEIMEKYGR